MGDVKLTTQEFKIVDFLENHSGLEVAWEELAQFAKDPTNVKMKTIKRAVSEIKRKYAAVNLPTTFDVKFVSLADDEEKPTIKATVVKAATLKVPQQAFVQLKRPTPAPVVIQKHPVQLDFDLDPLGFKRVKTYTGCYQLNDSEWEMFKYLHNNPGRIITISELRDKVMFPNYGSKLPARWFDAIGRVINNMRRQVFGLDKRLLTVKGAETSYLFQ